VRCAGWKAIQCSLCSTRTTLGWNFQVYGSASELPLDPNCQSTQEDPCPHYINNLDYQRYVVANKYVREFGFYINLFETQNGYDYLYYGPEGGLTGLTGNPTLGWRDFSVAASLQSQPGLLHFVTDTSGSDEGFHLNSARVCCTSTGDTNTALLSRHVRYTGFLLGTGDLIKLRASVTSNHLNFVMWGDPSGGKDFDIYVRCNAEPTPISYAYASTTGQEEFIHVPSGVCDTGTWYIAVSSYSGSGWFNLVVSEHKGAQHRNLRAGVTFDANGSGQPGVAALQDALRQAARHFFGATEGVVHVENIDFYNNISSCDSGCGSASCDICYYDQDGTATAGCGGRINVYRWYFQDPEGISHEFGHAYMCLPDEYYAGCGGNCWQCGHSNMAAPWGSQNNFCFYHNHKKDKTPGATDTTANPNWTDAYNQQISPWSPSRTPDNYDYRGFSDWPIGTIVTH